VESTNTLIGMKEVMAAVPYSRKTLIERIKAENITVYVSGDDRRRRLIASADLPRLTESRPVRDIEPAREYDGSAA
jgi:hypothetical protein